MTGPKLEKPRARKEAARVLGIALQTRLRRLYEAQQSNVENEIVVATADMAQCMYENVEFVIWALKTLGGMKTPPPDELKKITPPKGETPGEPNHVFKKPPEPVLLPDACTCAPLDAGIIGRDKHMVSCPKFVP